MIETLHRYDGVGLAAVQVGILKANINNTRSRRCTNTCNNQQK